MVQHYVVGEKVRLHGATNFLNRALKSGLNLDMPLCLDVGNSESKGIKA